VFAGVFIVDRPLTVYIDFKSPYAYLAVESTRLMAKELDIPINWLPFVLDIPSYLGSARLDRSGEVVEHSRSKEQWSGAKYAYYDCGRYPNLRSLTIRGTVKIWDTDLAATGMLWTRRQGDEVLQRYIDGMTYILGDDIYFGREHLPRIRWQLEGEHGPAPDVGYELLPDDVVEPATVAFGPRTVNATSAATWYRD
jgi:2-hydroxychromene-2-carboxylate isomerase